MKLVMIPAALLVIAFGTQVVIAQSGGTIPNSALPSDPTIKPKGQIVMLKSPSDRKQVGIRAHCSNGSVYWNPKIEEDLYYCEGSDAPTPTAK